MRVATLASWVSALIPTRASSCAWGNVCYKDHSVNAQPLEEIQRFRALTDTQFFVSMKEHIYWCCVFITTSMTKSCKVVCMNKRCNYLRRHTVPIRRSLLGLEKGGNILAIQPRHIEISQEATSVFETQPASLPYRSFKEMPCVRYRLGTGFGHSAIHRGFRLSDWFEYARTAL